MGVCTTCGTGTASFVAVVCFSIFFILFFLLGGGGGCRGAGGIIQRIVFLASPHLLWLFFRLGGLGGGGGDGWLGSRFVFRGGQCKDFLLAFSPVLLWLLPQNNVISRGCYGEGGSAVPHDITSTCLAHVRFQCGVLTGFLVPFPETRGPEGVEQMRA